MFFLSPDMHALQESKVPGRLVWQTLPLRTVSTAPANEWSGSSWSLPTNFRHALSSGAMGHLSLLDGVIILNVLEMVKAKFSSHNA